MSSAAAELASFSFSADQAPASLTSREAVAFAAPL
jgi:hypothetical protein